MFQVIKHLKLKAHYLQPKIVKNCKMDCAFSKLEHTHKDENIIPKLA